MKKLYIYKEVGLSKDPLEPTHPLPPTEPDLSSTELIAPAVDDGFHSPKSEINRSDIGSPPLKSKTNPSIFPVRCISSIFWDFFGKI